MTLEQLLADQLTGRARFLRDRNEIKSPELMEQAAATITRLQAELEQARDKALEEAADACEAGR